MNASIIGLGVVCVVAGLLGGNLKAPGGWEFNPIKSFPSRVMMILLGLVLFVLATPVNILFPEKHEEKSGSTTPVSTVSSLSEGNVGSSGEKTTVQPPAVSNEKPPAVNEPKLSVVPSIKEGNTTPPTKKGVINLNPATPPVTKAGASPPKPLSWIDPITGQDRRIWRDQTGLMWFRFVGWGYASEEDAVKHCKDLHVGGFADWRLATISELKYMDDNAAALKYPLIVDGNSTVWMKPISTIVAIQNWNWSYYQYSFKNYKSKFPPDDPTLKVFFPTVGAPSAVCVRG